MNIKQIVDDIRFDATNLATLSELPAHVLEDLENASLRFHGAVLRASTNR